eukprot:CAMPEP_0183383488 /NCGR_PEP_ID=MMETSP0164_2-20130417/127476_1 /TAXON_ID=221442 /ORGANISM="Coccolithus pelagicus ssp braarudi, Strain PLY182g" /LENGTH=86 /DNA_ID=CAMNT_0025561119 /DNA_START=633 /DNA_END=890 /DNA_ORIENTATION=-
MQKRAPIAILAAAGGEVPARLCFVLWVGCHIAPLGAGPRVCAAAIEASALRLHSRELLQAVGRALQHELNHQLLRQRAAHAGRAST